MKVYTVAGWLIGLAAAAFAFFTVGVFVLYTVSYGAIHSDHGDNPAAVAAVVLPTFIVVVATCLCLGYALKVAVVALARRAGLQKT